MLRMALAVLGLVSLVNSNFAAGAGAKAKAKATVEPGPKERVADTQFSVRRGFFREPFDLTITTRTAGATVYFTTNGSLPSPRNGTAYSYLSPVRIQSMTVLRAAAFKEGLAPSDTDTQTYFFLDQVGRQTGAGFPTTWGLNSGQPVPADYAMDPEIVDHPAYRQELMPALESLPSLSLVVTPEDLFDTVRGLYANPRESGDAWERPSSVEYFPTGGRKGFHLDCGVRIQGGWNRRPEESPKHAFRLVFRKRYGRGSLEYPLFGEGAATFDTLILRAGCNNTWLHWSGEERKRGEFLRDQWMRDSLRAMGHPSARGLFVHLYLNGLYWGLYNLCERPSAPFVAAHLGGQASDYDVRNGSHVLEGDDVGWKQLMSLIEGGVKEPAAYATLGPWLDRAQFADFFILNLYGANGDWDGASNWYAARRHQPAGPFQFFVWDGERTLERLDANALDFDAEDSPPRIFQRLRTNGEFRQLFAERAHRHLTGDGALTPGPAAERYERWSKEIAGAVIAESARWGDYRRDAHPYKTGPYELYTRDDHWRPEVQRLLNDYFPKRTAVVIRQFREANLW